MSNKKEITATEKLLDLIRSDDSNDHASQESSADDDNVAIGTEPDNNAQQEIHLENNDVVQQQNVESPPLTLEQDTESTPEYLPPAPKNFPPAGNKIDTEKYSSPISDVNDPDWNWYEKAKNQESFSCLRNLFRHIKIGIDIQPGVIHLVKTEIGKDKRTLLACESASFDYTPDPDKSPDLFDNPSLKGVLSQKLASAYQCGIKKPELWCSYAFCNPVAIYNITIPNVPQKDIPQAVFWLIKKEVDFDEKQTIFDYQIFKEVEIKGQQKLQAIVTLIPKREAHAIQNLFSDLGYPLTGLTFPAAAIQNFLQVTDSGPDSGPIVYFTVRDQNSFIDIFYKGEMLFSREIKTGVESFIESILDQAANKDILLDEDSAKKYIFDYYDGKKTRMHPDQDEEIENMLDFETLPVIERLIRQLLRTFEYCTTNFKIPPVSQIYTGGSSVLNANILNSIQERIHMKCSVIKPFEKGIFSFVTPPNFVNELNILPAAGLAISNQETTKNFLYTYLEKANKAISTKINTIIAGSTIVLALAIGGLSLVQHGQVNKMRQTISTLENSLNAQYLQDPRTSSTLQLIPAIAQIKNSHTLHRQSIERFQSIGAIQEITQNLPRTVKLTRLSFVLPQDYQTNEQSSSKKNESAAQSIYLTGVISAPESKQDFILLNVLRILSDHKFTSNPELLSSKHINSEDRTKLTFRIKLSINQQLLAEV